MISGAKVIDYLLKYVVKSEPVHDFNVQNLLLRGRSVGLWEAGLLLTAKSLTRASFQSLPLDLRPPGERSRKLKPLRILKQLQPTSEAIYEPDAFEKYFDRPTDLESLTIIDYFTEYTVTNSKVTAKGATGLHDLAGRTVRKLSPTQRDKRIVRVPFTTPADGELFYFQLLVTRVPARGWISYHRLRATLATATDDASRPDRLPEGVTYRDVANSYGLHETNAFWWHDEQPPPGDAPTATAAAATATAAAAAAAPATTTTHAVDLTPPRADTACDVQGPVRAVADNASFQQLTADQYWAASLLQDTTNQCVFIHGIPGSGKSYVLASYALWAEQQGRRILRLAPTGIAAYNTHGATIHSALRLRTIELVDASEITSFITTPANAEAAERLRNADDIILDEAAMTAAQLLETIDAVCQQLCDNKLPFGGKRILAAGDLFQLPPVPHIDIVVSEEAIADNPTADGLMISARTTERMPEYIFLSPLWQHFKAVELLQSHRQRTDPDFAAALNELRTFGPKPLLTKLLQERAVVPQPADAITLCAKRYEVHHINMTRIAANSRAGRDYIATDWYPPQGTAQAETIHLDPDAAAQQEAREIGQRDAPLLHTFLPLRERAPVIYLMNLNVEDGVTNGTFATVQQCTDTAVALTITNRSGAHELILRPVSLWFRALSPGAATSCRRTQLPLSLAYAATVHKMQGTTLPQAVVKLTEMWDSAQLYTALSRVPSRSNLYISGTLREHFNFDPSAHVLRAAAALHERLLQRVQPAVHTVADVLAAAHVSQKS